MDAGHSISTWRDVWVFIKRQLPSVFVTGKFNFITIHYCYIMGTGLLLSVIYFAIGDTDYIDALFQCSGAVTQSGLNTIDINKLHTSQQILLYMGAMLCNPIIIHSSVVFVRLYWFEKRFEDVVKEARSLRRTKSKGRNTFTTDDAEQGDSQTGEQSTSVGDRAVQLLRQTGRRMSIKSFTHRRDTLGSIDNGISADEKTEAVREPRRTRRASSAQSLESMRLPQQMNTEQHIRFLENQRNPKEEETLRIPSPREFDRGGRPEIITDSSNDDLQAPFSRQPDAGNEDAQAEPRQTTIATHLTFNEPEILRDRPRTGHLPPRLNQKYSATGGSRMSGMTQPQRTYTGGSLKRSGTGRASEMVPYLSYQATIGRNSFFVNLTEEQREELGGIEYRSLKTLALVLIFYFFAYHIIGIIGLTPWIYGTSYGNIVTEDGQGRAWWGVFTAASSFNDLGFTLTPDSMISFQDATWPLLFMAFLIVIGNTGFPCMLRFMIWFLSVFVRKGSALWEELQFLLDHPRRCFTLLFPRSATWWLFAILILLNGLDLLFFVVLDLDNTAVTLLSGWFKFLDGLFQAISTRTAGFAVVNLAALHPAIQVSYLIMMYISVFPIAISMRRTNVYEEKSLGLYGSPGEEEEDSAQEPSYVGAHLRKQLSFDLWYIFLGLFIIAIVEGDRLENTNEYAFTLFSCLFEIVSAYGTVGLSLGYPNINASFSSEFRTLSKLVIIAMQVRGRHRGLPYALDRAVLLPSESLHEKEKREAQRMLARRPSLAMSVTSAVDGHMEPGNFRPETGLSSGLDSHNMPTTRRERRLTGRPQNSAISFADNGQTTSGPARRGSDYGMFHSKQELDDRTSSSDS